ncbi:hypothetical protein B0T10DRAFT_491569 [Thelonectria olida]|uniref:[histone H3]-trimethyl-L-lysine(9) demethylase n=1 Tax=Thelonectria olida TaxID=1576542 RepID=A0A9P8W0I3_9HYPO|nr:hypothetical protein B0T10DRAFT_491569 [Thelonectria olida]
MSTLTDAGSSAAAPVAPPTDDSIAAPGHEEIECAKTDETLPQKNSQSQPGFLHSPPDSNNNLKSDVSDSELSDLDEEPILSDAPMPAPPSENGQNDKDDIGEVLPDHWSGSVPIFKPTMDQFKDFKRFMEAVDSYGMKSGIIKIIPPSEWKDSLPPIDELVKRVKVREPIKQDIMGSSGTYRQVNILHGRSYNLPQWRQLCDQSEHQPPARRGERRANVEKARPVRKAAAPKPAVDPLNPPKKRGRGRPRKHKIKEEPKAEDGDDRPMTPVSPNHGAEEKDKPVVSIEKELGEPVDEDDDAPKIGRMGIARPAKSKTQSTSARRKYSRREGSAVIDEAAFKDWDYRMDISQFTPERCEELERVYWKTLTYAQPLYGADLMGTLFDESTEQWNLNKLPNLLDVLGTKVPGVNTAYLYLGMWKATFAWHLEDVDLYSINYLHFGAPKQWYSISQADARRFEAAMKSIWPQDAKACDQFLRHKAFLISPQHLQQHYGIKVNRCLSYPGEFVVTYPYGYHSGYNLGYNCAEAVNFALDSWLDLAKVAKKCDCAQAQDSVWVNVYEIERKLRGESTEYEETEDEDDEDDDEMSGLPTPPAAHGVRFKGAGGKRKRGPGDKGSTKAKKIKLRLRTSAETPCCLCPNDFPASEFLPTDDGRKVHKLCAMYLPETYIETVDGKEVVFNVEQIHKDRLDLKCMYCRSRRGACFQCSENKCSRAYHATCAAAAGVFVEEQDVPVFGEDGTEYKEQAFEFSCRFHRTKRDRKLDGVALEADQRIRSAAAALKKGDICQLQYLKGDIFAGCVVENRSEDRTLLLDVLPNGDRVEVEWKWLLLPDPTDYHLPQASANALPMPTSRKAKEKLNVKRKEDSMPRKDDVFGEGYTWAEFKATEVSNPAQVKVDFTKPDQIWHYLGKTSTDLRAQYTEDPSKLRHNPRGNFLDTVPKPPRPAPIRPPQQSLVYPHAGSYGGPYPPQTSMPPAPASARPEKPYVYKPRMPVQPSLTPHPFTTQRFKLASPSLAQPGHTQYPQQQYPPNQSYQHQGVHSPQRFDIKTPQTYMQHHAPRPQAAPAHQGQYQHAQWPQAPAAPGGPNAQVGPYQGQYQRAPPPVTPSNPVRSYQVHTSIYQKYQFFQVNHNRDSTKYRTPYAAWGGFTNGYEGDVRAYYMSNQDALMRRASLNTGTYQSSPYASSAPPPQNPHQGSVSSPGTQFHRPAPQTASYGQNPFTHGPRQGASPSTHPGNAPRQQYTPAIKAQYMSPNPAIQQALQQQAVQQQAARQQALQQQALQNQALRQQAPQHQVPQQQVPQYQASQQQVPQKQAHQVHQQHVQQHAPHQQVHPQQAAQQPARQFQVPQQQVPQQQVPQQQPLQQQAPKQQALQQQTPQPQAPQKQAPPQEPPQHAMQPPATQAQATNPKPAAAPTQKVYKIPPKESPVPLPANFLAAMTSTAHIPTTTQAQPVGSAPSKGSTPKTSQKQPLAPSPGTSATGMGSKISTTPVPVPQLPGIAQSPTSAQSSPVTTGQTASVPGSGRRTRSMSQVSPTGQQQSPPSAPPPQQAGVSSDNTNAETPSFADVPGGGSMEFVEKLMRNLRRVSRRGS